MPTKTFHLFPELPLELREMIWERTFIPRHLWPKIRINAPTYVSHEGSGQELQRSCDPVALQVNRESRAVAMRFYQMRRDLSIPRTSYINFEIDEICIELDSMHDDQGEGIDPYMELIPCDEALLNVSKADLSKFRYLRVGVRFCGWCQFRTPRRFYNWYMDWAHAFSSMKVVMIEISLDGAYMGCFNVFCEDMMVLFQSKGKPDGVRFHAQEQERSTEGSN